MCGAMKNASGPMRIPVFTGSNGSKDTVRLLSLPKFPLWLAFFHGKCPGPAGEFAHTPNVPLHLHLQHCYLRAGYLRGLLPVFRLEFSQM